MGEDMKKYVNRGSMVAFVLDGRTYSFQTGVPVNVHDGFMEKLMDHISKLEDITGPPVVRRFDQFGKIEVVPASEIKPEKKPKKPPKDEKDEYTKKDLFAMNKKEQVALLKELGHKGKTPKLEKDRVKKILELSK